jgi:hypothetical protein
MVSQNAINCKLKFDAYLDDLTFSVNQKTPQY